jgi:photosystem II stability/assembly factor-like uncharacterized protein
MARVYGSVPRNGRLFFLYCAVCLALAHGIVLASPEQSVATSHFPLTNNILYLDIAHAGSRIVCVGERGLIVYSDDAGDHWQRASVPIQVLLTAVFFIDADTGWAVGHDGVILRSDDAALTWQVQHSSVGEDAPLFDVRFQDHNHGIAVGAYGAYKMTDDGGKSWKSQIIFADDYHLYAIIEAAAGELFIAGEYATLLRSEDQGVHWRAIATPVQSSFFGMLSLSPDHMLLYGLRGTVLQSVDKGNTWRRIATPAQASLQGGVRLDQRQAVIAGLGGTLITTSDGGNTFHKLSIGNGAEAISQVMAVSPEELVIVGAFGIRRISLPGAFNEQHNGLQ